MGKMLCLVVLVSLLVSLGNATPRHVLRDSLPSQPFRYSNLGRANKNVILPFSLHLRQQNLPLLKEAALEIADPDSPRYRQFLSKDEVIAMTASREEDVHAALRFAARFGDAKCALSGDRVTLHCAASVGSIESMFETSMFVLERAKASDGVPTSVLQNPKSPSFQAISHIGPLSIPLSLKGVVEVVSGLTLLPKTKVSSDMGGTVEFPEIVRATRASSSATSSSGPLEPPVPGIISNNCSSAQRACANDINQAEGCCPGNTRCCLNIQNGLQCCQGRLKCCRGECVDPYTALCRDEGAEEYIKPNTLRNMYNVPLGQRAALGSSVMQSITAFEDDYSQGALLYFTTFFGEDGVPSVTRRGGFCISEGCDQVESDLDMQYITSMGRDVPTWFWFNSGSEYTLEWAKKVLNTKNPPLVHSISYISGEYQLGREYILASNAEFVKLGAMGVTIMACAGDTGTTGWSINYPVPTGPNNVLAPCGNCPPADEPNMCSQVMFESDDGICNIPSGLFSRDTARVAVCQNDFINNTDCQKAFGKFEAEASTKCDFKLVYDDNNDPRLFSRLCSCAQLPVVTVGGCTVRGYSYSYKNGSPVTSLYPASSPFVTAVGATQLTSFPDSGCGQRMPGNKTVHCKHGEVVSSISTGSRITSGGGFSSISSMEGYQQEEVGRYLSYGFEFNPPAEVYNASNRAYPDVAFNGHNWLVAKSTNVTHEACPCQIIAVDGTSCSSPGFSGLVSLIASHVDALGYGKGLGLLNPLLYSIARKEQAAFNDIVRGDNACTEASCSVWGWHAARGWDPASGLGTPNFELLLEAVLAAVGRKRSFE